MSEERRRRQQERQATEGPKKGLVRKLLVGIAVVAAFGAAYYLGQRKKTSRLDSFAQCMAGKGVKMYGLYWCAHCADQEAMFGSSFQYIPYVECGIKGSHQEEPRCLEAGVKNFPTWQFANGELIEGPQTLPFLSARTGCRLP
jgi:hypothetical protein